MFITRSRHNEVVRLLEASAQEKDSLYQNQLRMLEDQIHDLKQLIFSPNRDVPPVMREADAILSPNDDSPIYQPSDEEREVLDEANKIFSGEYEGFLN